MRERERKVEMERWFRVRSRTSLKLSAPSVDFLS